MAVDERVKEALRIENVSAPPEFPVEKISVEDYIDSDGEESLRVSALLSEDFDEFKISGAAVGKLKLSIHDGLIEHGIHLYPPVRFMKPSDLAPEPKPKRRNARRAA